MAPNANSRCVGDFEVSQPSNTALYGFGDMKIARDLKPARNLELTSVSSTPEIKTTSQPLRIASAKGLSLVTVDGNVDVLPVNPSASASVTITAQNSGFMSLNAGSGHMTLTTTNTGNFIVSSAANSSVTSGGTYTSSSTGNAILKSTGGTLTASAKTTASFSGETSAALTSAGQVDIEAPTVNVGSSNCAALQVGRDACDVSKFLGKAITLGSATSVTTIPGRLLVEGDMTTVSSTVTTIEDNSLVLNQTPSISGRDSGLVLKRHPIDVAVGTADLTLTLDPAGVAANALVVALVDSSAIAANWVLKFSEAAKSDTVSVSSVTDNNVTLAVALVNAYTSAAVVTAYKSQANTLHYNESADEWRFAYSLEDGSSANIATSHYADIHCRKVIVEEGFQSASSATKVVSVTDNAGEGNAVTVPGLKSRGTYQLVVESVEEDGATASFFLSKAVAAQTNASAFMLSAGTGLLGEEISVGWPANSPPVLYHSAPRTVAAGVALEYKVYFSTVGV